jgi:hypothetical protein
VASGCLVPRKPRSKPRRNSALERAIIAALTAGNGRSHRVPSETELIQRLVEDGFQFKPAALFATWVCWSPRAVSYGVPGTGCGFRAVLPEVDGNEPSEPISLKEQRLRWVQVGWVR